MTDEYTNLFNEYEELAEKDEKSDNRKIGILVVDDDEGILESIKDTLNDFLVFTATNGQAAIELLDKNIATKSIYENKIQCIIMDARMPSMNGFEATRIIKKKYPDIEIIMHTAFDGDFKTSYVVEHRFLAYYEKGNASTYNNLIITIKEAVAKYTNRLKQKEFQREMEAEVENKEKTILKIQEKMEKSNDLSKIGIDSLLDDDTLLI